MTAWQERDIAKDIERLLHQEFSCKCKSIPKLLNLEGNDARKYYGMKCGVLNASKWLGCVAFCIWMFCLELFALRFVGVVLLVCGCAVVLLPVSAPWSCFVALQHGTEHTKLLATLLMGDVATAQAEFGSFFSARELVFFANTSRFWNPLHFCIFRSPCFFSFCLRSKLKMFFMMFFHEIKVRK